VRGAHSILVIGGAAGLAAAIAARMKGFAVAVWTAASLPTISLLAKDHAGHHGGAAAAWCGDFPDNGQVFRGVRSSILRPRSEANFSHARIWRASNFWLHQRWSNERKSAESGLLWNTPVTGLCRGCAIVGDSVLQARWIIGAMNPLARRRWIGLDPERNRETRLRKDNTSMNRGPIAWRFIGGQQRRCTSRRWARPTCVALISRDARCDFRMPEGVPRLAGYLRYADPITAERGAVTVTRSLNQVYVGISRSLRPLRKRRPSTGEGLCLSFYQAIVLAGCVGQRNLRVTSRRTATGEASEYHEPPPAAAGCYPSLRARTLRCLAGEPELFRATSAVTPRRRLREFLAATSLRLAAITDSVNEKVADELVSKPVSPGFLYFPGSSARLCSMLFRSMPHPWPPPAKLSSSSTPAQSKVHWTLESTVHTVHGSFAFKKGSSSGYSTGKASGEIIVDATSGNSGNDGRDKKMHKDVLESVKYTEVIFRPDRGKGKLLRRSLPVQVHGVLVLHAAHELTVPLQAQFAGIIGRAARSSMCRSSIGASRIRATSSSGLITRCQIELELKGIVQNPRA